MPSIRNIQSSNKTTSEIDSDKEEPSLLCQSFTDTGNAERFICAYSSTVRHCFAFKRWLIFDGGVWVRDDSEQVRTLAKRVIIKMLQQADSASDRDAEKFARRSLDSQRITNMLKEAQSELAIRPDELDNDPDLLAFRNGTVDLRTGELRPSCSADFITKQIRFNYRPGAKCPLFVNTLMRLMGSESDLERATRLVATLQVCLGYSLTGHTSEKVVFFLYGSGNNGKTTILTLFQSLLGEYAALLQIETLMIRQENNNSQADLADLRGARFVVTSETEEGQKLAEGKLKRITQGMGKIKAVPKYQNPFTFPETHKLWIDANHKPMIRGTDNAIWNRVYPFPFEVTIAAGEIDRELPTKLAKEAEGIWFWAVTGSVIWYREGLPRPDEIVKAARAYRDEMDQIGRFITDRCMIGPGRKVSASNLYTAYKTWAQDAGEPAMTANSLGRKLTDRPGIQRRETSSSPLYIGIGLPRF